MGFFLFLVGFAGCKAESKKEDPEPFVRLLKDQSFKSEIFKRPMNYAVLLPKEYTNENMTFPVVYLLHGWGDDESAWYQGGNIQYYVDQYASETVPMIYVMPEAFNTYYVNKYNGNYPYMDMFVEELVPTIDSLFRTKPEPEQRAVMGYSMGGYGALILPAKQPEIFKTGVVLSMSIRTDAQYLEEPQGVFDVQWGRIFGGIGASGTERLTDYFLSYSPFHFFSGDEGTTLLGQNFFIDCGDDEESLSVTNDALHVVLRDVDFPHVYRVNNGAHSWSYWHRELREALIYISLAMQEIPYPGHPFPVDPGPPVSISRIIDKHLNDSNLTFRMVLPENYQGTSYSYPVIIIIHDRNVENMEEKSQALFSLFNSQMKDGELSEALIVEVPVQASEITSEILEEVLNNVKTNYRMLEDKKNTILIANNEGGKSAFELMPECSELFNTCYLFDANLPANASMDLPGVSFYLDICDQGINYNSYHALYLSLRQNNINHEYRVRQGDSSHESFLNGLSEAVNFINNHLNY